MNEEFKHYTVMKKEAVDGLNCQNGLIYLDCTLGGGGHSFEIASAIQPDGKLIAFDVDEVAINIASEKLKPFSNVTIVKDSYSNFEETLRRLNISKITGGVLLDLGASYYQLTSQARGFSFSKDAKLDMRFDLDSDFTAYDLINTYSEQELADVFYYYGEERLSRRLARVIVEKRTQKKIETTLELADIIKHALPYKNSRVHPATRIFQAIRIEVNSELKNVENTLKNVVTFLEKNARIVVITFHSLEDRIVKRIFRELSSDCNCKKADMICKCPPKSLELINKKPLCATDEEIRVNPPSRSAKLRVAKKV
ncbi:MAG: 16S rRNA (cytosine(1402)-N(4))-methyltransferase RsmH [Candidatus Gastranaerophilales bacterium]|nr:16S rRNA (cytosine(1402)-N(4))-methyltransferase RsmH [Candidatus Gastranaerophilales bacterium]